MYSKLIRAASEKGHQATASRGAQVKPTELSFTSSASKSQICQF